MQSLRKLDFQNQDAKKCSPVEIWISRLYSPAAACWIPFFIKISFSFWPLLSHHKSVFYPTAFQGFPHSRELQTQQPVINFTCECTVLIELRLWFKVISKWGNCSPIAQLLAAQFLHTGSLNVISEVSLESFQSHISEEKGFGVRLRIEMQKDLGITDLAGIS